MSTLGYVLLAGLACILDLVAFIALILGGLSFFQFENLARWRWHLLAGGALGLVVLLPLADYFLRKALSSILGT